MVREIGPARPADPSHTVLLIPGGLCTAAFYEDLVQEPALAGAPIRFVATTIPGFGDTPPLADISMENMSRTAGQVASELGCDAVVGHSIGGNIALEMVAAGDFAGPVLLLEPSFTRADEAKELTIIDRIGRIPVLGGLVWRVALASMGRAMKNELPPDRLGPLVAEMRKASPSFCKAQTASYLSYLDHHGSLVPRLCDSGATALVAFGDRSMIGFTDEERRALDACPATTVIDVADSGHMMMYDQPARTAELVVELVERV